MFSSSAYGPRGVSWLQPVRRRRRRRVPAGPILPGVLLLALAGGAFAFVRSRDDGDDPSRAIAQRFADAWARGDLEAAWRLTTAKTRSEQRLAGFRESYRQATRAATVTEVRVGRAGEPRGGRVPVPVVVRTRLFGEQRGTIAFPVRADRRDRARRVDARAAAARPAARGARAPADPAPAAARAGARRRRPAPEPRAGGGGAGRRRRRRATIAAAAWRRSTTSGSAAAPAPSCATGAASSRASTSSRAAR